MSARARVLKPKYIVAQSSGATFNGPWLNVIGLDNLAFHCTWDGTTAGTISVDGSNAESVRDPSTEADSPSTRLTPAPVLTVASGNPAGGPSQLIVPVPQTAVAWVRLVFTRSAGTGNFNCGFAAKGL